MVLLVIASALLLDRLLGEPRRYHPLVGFGICATWIEAALNIKPELRLSILTGLIAFATLITPCLALVIWLDQGVGNYRVLLDIALVYWAVGARSLTQHVMQVARALGQKNLTKARLELSKIVSRSTENLDQQQISAATIETTLENGNDAIFAVIFWYLIGGAPMVLAYRLTNTLDAMWGYRNVRFEYFGKAAAKFDDLLNFVPARLTALSYALLGKPIPALRSWQCSASELASPNAGPVMTAGAGSLELTLGGPADYSHSPDNYTEKPFYGGDKPPQADDIRRASDLVTRCVFAWLGVVALVPIISYLVTGSQL